MSVELKIDEVRTQILDFPRFDKPGLPQLHGFFQLWRYPRTFSHSSVLSDVNFYDLHITHYVAQKGTGRSRLPHPGMFEDFFPRIVRRLVRNNVLTLFVRGVDRDHFDEVRVIESVLAPRHLRYILLSNPPTVRMDPRIQVGVGNLLFEWSADALGYVAEQWFETPAIEIEGYIASESSLGLIARLYFEPDCEEAIRELIRGIDLGFRLWPDNNGLFLVSDKLDREALEARLELADLNAELSEAAPRYQGGEK